MTTLSEADSKAVLRRYGIPLAAEEVVATADEAAAAAERIGYPVAVKLSGPSITHKTERGLVRLGVRDADGVRAAGQDLLDRARPEDGTVAILVGQMVSGVRELIAGVVRDPQFGPCVMLGVGGVLAEALGDVAFRLAPLSRADAEELADDLSSQALLGPLRGEPAVDRDALATIVQALGDIVTDDPTIQSIDLNPLIVHDGVPIAVDALVERAGPSGREREARGPSGREREARGPSGREREARGPSGREREARGPSGRERETR